MNEMPAEHTGPKDFEVVSITAGTVGQTPVLSGDDAVVFLGITPANINATALLRRLQAELEASLLLWIADGEELGPLIRGEATEHGCMLKPANPRQFLERLGAIFPELQAATFLEVSGSERIVVDDLEMDTGNRTIKQHGVDVELTATEFDILAVLLRAAGHVVTREHVARLVLGRRLTAMDRSIDNHISRLRRKLGPCDSGKARIISIRNHGYLYPAMTKDT